MDLKLNGKTAVVTGGSEGIGKGIALLLDKEGVDVAICARRKEPLEAAAAEIAQATGRKITPITADLRSEISSGNFREDLYHRLNVVAVRSPALSERRDDIPALVAHFMKRLSATSGLPVREIGDDAMAVLQSHAWPGNVRQLRNIVERLLILAIDDAAQAISADLLPSDLSGGAPWSNGGKSDLVISLPLREAREIFERDYLLAQINRFGGNISRTAAFIGMERSALHRKLKSLGVGPAGGREQQAFNA